MNDWPSVIGLGEVLWDVFYRADGSCERRLGGAPANFAFHAAQQGVTACTISAVGNDAAGDALAQQLRESGLACVLQRVPWSTGEVHICLNAEGIPHYRICPDAAWDYLAATPQLLDIARHARVVCFGSLAQRSASSREAIASFLAAMPHGENAWRVFDVNLRCGFYTTGILRSSMQHADVLKLNDEEMEIIGRMEGFNGLTQLEQAAALVQRYRLRLLILTCGSIGSYVLGEGGHVLSWRVTPQVEVVDTVGAGDSFTAAFMAALLRGHSVAEAHDSAVHVAARVCMKGASRGEANE